MPAAQYCIIQYCAHTVYVQQWPLFVISDVSDMVLYMPPVCRLSHQCELTRAIRTENCLDARAQPP